MKFTLQFLIGFSGLIAISCIGENEQLSSRKLINMDSVISAQIPFGAVVEKNATFDSESSTGVVKITNNWKVELAAFGHLDIINKEVYRNFYRVDHVPDPNSNLFLKVINATDSSAPIRQIKILFKEIPVKIVRVDAMVRESSSYYSNNEKLYLEFDPHTGKLEKYVAAGEQKIAWFKPKKYEVRAFIKYPAVH